MKTICNLLDDAKRKNPDICSDRILARTIGVSNIPPYRKGLVIPNDQTATRLAELCGLSHEVVIASCHAAKAETPETKRAWNNLYKMAVNACIAVTVAWVLHFNLSDTTQHFQQVALNYSHTMYIMLSPVSILFVLALLIFAHKTRSI